MQSQQEVNRALAALGLDGARDLLKESKELNELFRVRNQITHEMDMTPMAVKRSKGARTRHERTVTSYRTMCHRGLDYTQRVLNELAEALAKA